MPSNDKISLMTKCPWRHIAQPITFYPMKFFFTKNKKKFKKIDYFFRGIHINLYFCLCGDFFKIQISSRKCQKNHGTCFNLKNVLIFFNYFLRNWKKVNCSEFSFKFFLWISWAMQCPQKYFVINGKISSRIFCGHFVHKVILSLLGILSP